MGGAVSFDKRKNWGEGQLSEHYKEIQKTTKERKRTTHRHKNYKITKEHYKHMTSALCQYNYNDLTDRQTDKQTGTSRQTDIFRQVALKTDRRTCNSPVKTDGYLRSSVSCWPLQTAFLQRHQSGTMRSAGCCPSGSRWLC